MLVTLHPVSDSYLCLQYTFTHLLAAWIILLASAVLVCIDVQIVLLATLLDCLTLTHSSQRAREQKASCSVWPRVGTVLKAALQAVRVNF